MSGQGEECSREPCLPRRVPRQVTGPLGTSPAHHSSAEPRSPLSWFTAEERGHGEVSWWNHLCKVPRRQGNLSSPQHFPPGAVVRTQLN